MSDTVDRSNQILPSFGGVGGGSECSVALLLSGGVDSSVAAYELHRQGIPFDSFYIKIGPEDDKEWNCTSEEDLEMATAVARKYGSRLEVVDCHREYWERVTTYTMEKVRAGFTPNPDVMCNRLIKFGAFHEKRGKDYDLIATGHYARTEIIDGRKWLVTSPDPVKDQTDFLAQIYDWQLRKAVFPIGHYMKDEVRRIAEREHLINARRKDSQGICFLGKINYNDYIRRYLGEMPGDCLELETGKLIGRHKGHWFHTIGQRHGLGFGGGPWFVVKKDVERNILYVSKGYDPQAAYKDTFLIRDLHLLVQSASLVQSAECRVQSSSEVQSATAQPNSALCTLHSALTPNSALTFKIRHTPEFHSAVIEDLHDGTYRIRSAKPVHGVAPGQFCVLYDDQRHRCFGSAEIAAD